MNYHKRLEETSELVKALQYKDGQLEGELYRIVRDLKGLLYEAKYQHSRLTWLEEETSRRKED